MQPLEIGNSLTECPSFLGVLKGGIVTCLSESDALGRDRYAALVQHLHRRPETFPFVAKSVFHRHLAVVEHNLCGGRRSYAHLSMERIDCESRSVTFHYKGDDTLGSQAPVHCRKQNEYIGFRSVRYISFGAVEDVGTV